MGTIGTRTGWYRIIITRSGLPPKGVLYKSSNPAASFASVAAEFIADPVATAFVGYNALLDTVQTIESVPLEVANDADYSTEVTAALTRVYLLDQINPANRIFFTGSLAGGATYTSAWLNTALTPLTGSTSYDQSGRRSHAISVYVTSDQLPALNGLVLEASDTADDNPPVGTNYLQLAQFTPALSPGSGKYGFVGTINCPARFIRAKYVNGGSIANVVLSLTPEPMNVTAPISINSPQNVITAGFTAFTGALTQLNAQYIGLTTVYQALIPAPPPGLKIYIAGLVIKNRTNNPRTIKLNNIAGMIANEYIIDFGSNERIELRLDRNHPLVSNLAATAVQINSSAATDVLVERLQYFVS